MNLPVPRYQPVTHHHQVVIVGAGASGLAAASKLITNGVEDVVVLEASDRTGGRIHS